MEDSPQVTFWKCHQKVVSKVTLHLCIPITGMVRTIWHKVFLRLRVSFDGLVISKDILFGSIYCIVTHLDVVAEVLEVQISVFF